MTYQRLFADQELVSYSILGTYFYNPKQVFFGEENLFFSMKNKTKSVRILATEIQIYLYLKGRFNSHSQ